MTRVIAIANQKGGVGKTTTAVNLCASLSLSGCRVLLVDLDPQGNATMGSGVHKNELEVSIYDWLIENAPLANVVARCQGGYDLLPGNTDLTAAELDLLRQERREFRMRDRLAEAAAQASAGEESARQGAGGEGGQRYDFIIIDCPPSLNILTLNALIASDGVLIPMQCEYYALEGLTALLDTIEGVRARGNPGLVVEGLLRTMYDPRNSLTRDVSRQLIQYFGDKVFRTVIPRNVRLAEAPSHGLPCILYDRHSRGAVAYLALAGELKRKYGAAA